jgi:plasmid stabilization system protein ParE
MNITFDSAASDDLDHIFIWIAKDSPDAAHEMIVRIKARIAALATEGFAHMGRVGLVEGARELIEHPFIIVYQAMKCAKRSSSWPSCMVHRIGC